MKLNLKYVEGKWFDFDTEVKVKVKMFPDYKGLSLNLEKFTDDDLEIVFKACCEDWEGIVDQNDNPLVCNDENKEVVLDLFMDLVNFVLEKQQEIREEFEDSKKN